MTRRHLLLILFIDLVWAVNTIAIKEAVTAVPPLLAVAMRYVVLLVACSPWMRWRPGRMRLILATGAVTGALSFGLGGISFAVADNVSALAIAGQLGVPFSLLLAIWFYGERIRWKRMGAIALAFSGVALLAFDPAIVHERLGLLLSVLAALVWAFGNILFRELKGEHVLNIFGWQAVVSIPLLLAASAVFEPGSLNSVRALPLHAAGWIVYSALAASMIGHAGMAWLLQRYPVSTMTPLTLPTPLLSVVLATIVYGLPITVPMVIGGLLTLAGVTIIALRTPTLEPQ